MVVFPRRIGVLAAAVGLAGALVVSAPAEAEPRAPTCSGLVATIVGTNGSEVLSGTAGDDVIVGRGGNDTISGLGGDDTICGGSGDDTILGGGGADTILGGSGSDHIIGGGKRDTIKGGKGDDLIEGQSGRDNIKGQAGWDMIWGGGGSDSCTTGEFTVGCESGHRIFGAGTHQVGSDIQPGVYRNKNFSDFCYWERLSGFSGEFDDIIANDFTSVSAIVTIKPSDAGFSGDGDCGSWTSNLSPVTASLTADFDPGTYIVGVDIAAGTWRNKNFSDFCYWERLSGFSGEFDDIIANDFTSDQSIVTISASDVGFLADEECGTWEKIG
ncbi:MAG: calcium-binding protein [Acidimicrobiia bacterium]